MPTRAKRHQPRHASVARREDRGSAYQRGYDRHWRKVRLAYLMAHPMCVAPGCGKAATDVDHLDSRGPRGEKGYDWDNLQPLCSSCHSKKTARERMGK